MVWLILLGALVALSAALNVYLWRVDRRHGDRVVVGFDVAASYDAAGVLPLLAPTPREQALDALRAEFEKPRGNDPLDKAIADLKQAVADALAKDDAPMGLDRGAGCVSRSPELWSLEWFERFLVMRCVPDGVICGEPVLLPRERDVFAVLFREGGPTWGGSRRRHLLVGGSVERRAWLLAAFALFTATYVRKGSVVVVGSGKPGTYNPVLRAADAIVARDDYLRSIWCLQHYAGGRLRMCVGGDRSQIAVAGPLRAGTPALVDGERPVAVLCMAPWACSSANLDTYCRPGWSTPFLLSASVDDVKESGPDVA